MTTQNKVGTANAACRRFYGVKAGAADDALLGRGVFDLLREAKAVAMAFRCFEIWAYEENERGERTSARRVLEREAF